MLVMANKRSLHCCLTGIRRFLHTCLYTGICSKQNTMVSESVNGVHVTNIAYLNLADVNSVFFLIYGNGVWQPGCSRPDEIFLWYV